MQDDAPPDNLDSPIVSNLQVVQDDISTMKLDTLVNQDDISTAQHSPEVSSEHFSPEVSQLRASLHATRSSLSPAIGSPPPEPPSQRVRTTRATSIRNENMNQSTGTCTPVEQMMLPEASMKFKPGDKVFVMPCTFHFLIDTCMQVRAAFGAGSGGLFRHYPGTIADSLKEGTYHVVYDDGDEERFVQEKYILNA